MNSKNIIKKMRGFAVAFATKKFLLILSKAILKIAQGGRISKSIFSNAQMNSLISATKFIN